MADDQSDPSLTYRELLRQGTMSVGVYRPRGVDPQQPHAQDEVYIVSQGSGVFVRGADRTPFRRGDVLFVGAGETHRFEDFDDELELWVVFYGPPGGETAATHVVYPDK